MTYDLEDVMLKNKVVLLFMLCLKKQMAGLYSERLVVTLRRVHATPYSFSSASLLSMLQYECTRVKIPSGNIVQPIHLFLCFDLLHCTLFGLILVNHPRNLNQLLALTI